MWCRVVVVLFLISSVSLGGPAAAESGPFVVDELLEGVWLFRVPATSATYTNSLVIERDAGLLVVESQPSPAAARRLIEAIHEVSPKPIRYLVLSHPHVESTGGASAFPESTLVIASAITHDALADDARDLAADIPLRASVPEAWVAPPRVLPQLLVGGTTVLADGRQRLELLGVAKGHYPGSLILRIEEPALYYIGAMATTDRNPHADAEFTDVGAWGLWLNSLLFAQPKTIVPLRGETLDVPALRVFRDSLAWLISRVDYAHVERIPVDEAVDFTLNSEGLDKHFDVDAKPSFLRGMIQRLVDKRYRTKER